MARLCPSASNPMLHLTLIREHDMADKRALLVLTSHDKLGETDKQTGFYWEEMATPYWALRDHGLSVDIASIKGGQPPADPASATDDAMTEAVTRFQNDDAAMKALKNSAEIATVDATAYEVVFFAGGHGTMWDFRQTPLVGQKIVDDYGNGAVIAAVCHGPAALLGATLERGEPLVKGRRVSGFTDAEEKAAGLTEVVPFLLETELRNLGAHFDGEDENFAAHAVRDGQLVTGQNPASSKRVAELIIDALDS